MSVAHILDLLKEYIILAIFIVLLFLFFYKIVYKKIMKGQKEIKTKKTYNNTYLYIIYS